MRDNQAPIKASYRAVRDQMYPGDVIAFSGKSLFNIGTSIATFSNVVHVGTVVHTAPFSDAGKRYLNLLAESAGAGVQISKLSKVISDSDGCVWWLPLSSEVRQMMDMEAFFSAIWESKGKPYDMAAAIGSALDGPLGKRNKADSKAFFCSELVTYALMKAKAIKRLNYSEVTPAGIVGFRIFEPDYYQLRGKLTPIRGFNSSLPTSA